MTKFHIFNFLFRSFVIIIAIHGLTHSIGIYWWFNLIVFTIFVLHIRENILELLDIITKTLKY